MAALPPVALRGSAARRARGAVPRPRDRRRQPRRHPRSRPRRRQRTSRRPRRPRRARRRARPRSSPTAPRRTAGAAARRTGEEWGVTPEEYAGEGRCARREALPGPYRLSSSTTLAFARPLLPLRRLLAQPPGGRSRRLFYGIAVTHARYPSAPRRASQLLHPALPRAAAPSDRPPSRVCTSTLASSPTSPAAALDVRRRDVDDPRFESPRAAQPAERRCVRRHRRVRARRYEALGVERPWHVVPQGVALDSLNEESSRDIALRHREPATCVIGYVSRLPAAAGRPRRRQSSLQRRAPARPLERDRSP